MKRNQKIIVFTGGVYSSIGKGITLSSVGKILTELGYKVSVLKLDPYLNINSGLLSPDQHGEVFVTGDGEETDLDLGHYERFLDLNISKYSCVTSGKIYDQVLNKERKGENNGATVQIIPDVINAIHNAIFELADKEPDSDFLLIEIGGTVGDIESIPFLTAARQLTAKICKNSLLFIHIVPTIYLKNTDEFKSKPAQHSINQLLTFGIIPDLLILKSESEIDPALKQKICNSSSIPVDKIISCIFQKSIYTLPSALFQEKIHEKILSHFNLPIQPEAKFTSWDSFIQKLQQPKQQELNLLIAGKYANSSDAYLSIIESFKFAAIHENTKLNITIQDSEEINGSFDFSKVDLICIPYGFGTRGVEGKLAAIKYARENKIPLLGICFGMQLSIIEYANNVLNLKGANSVEIDPNTKHPIYISKDIDTNNNLVMRLGYKSVEIQPNTFAHDIFKQTSITARHRHKYVFNKQYTDYFKDSDMIFSAYSHENIDVLEMIELKNHPFFVATQYHPEFESRPCKPSPLFQQAIKAALDQK